MTSHYIPEALRQRVLEQAGNRCGYCLSAQQYVMGQLEIEHIRPKSLDGETMRTICGLRVASATVTKVRK
jgi:hypothetical protein